MKEAGVHMVRQIVVKNSRLKIETAVSPFKRSMGLMYRKKLDPESGMLFIFPENKVQSFWMKDTHIPLSIAYVNEYGMILNIENMEPFSLNSVRSVMPCKYALEVNQGWFEENGVQVGDQIKIISEDV